MKRLFASFLVFSTIFGFAETHAAELDERVLIEQKARTALAQEDFAVLEAMAEKYRSPDERTSSGLWRHSIFFISLRRVYGGWKADSPGWTALSHILEKWETAYPKSVTRKLVEADVLLKKAYFQRARRFGDNVTPQSERERALARTREYLDAIKNQASDDPRWYNLMLNVALAEQWPLAEFETLWEESLDRHPTYYENSFSAMRYFIPKWGGSAEALEAFAVSAQEQSQATEGYGLYARIYWVASQSQYGLSLFTESKVNWPMMKLGILDVLDAYPDEWNLQNFAKFACLAEDTAFFSELMLRSEAQLIKAVWGRDLRMAERCKQLANSPEAYSS